MAIYDLLTLGTEAIKSKREETFRYWEKVKSETRGNEDEVKAVMDDARRALIKEKSFKLLQQMFGASGGSDPNLFSDGVIGLPVIGHQSVLEEFPECQRPPSITALDLMKAARWHNHALQSSSRLPENDELAKGVWEATKKEIDAKWLEGPYTLQQLKELLGPLFVISRRFGVKQGDKYRPIDDLSESWVNAAYGSSNKIDLGGVDEVCVLVRTFLQAIGSDRSIKLVLSSGEILEGVLHHSLSVQQAKDLVGRTLDLSDAYKQLLVKKSHEWTQVLRIWDHDAKQFRLYLNKVLPFGASGSVLGFNRYARAIWKIGVVQFGLVWCNYFDDYPMIDISSSHDDAQTCAERFLRLIGWDFSLKEHKRKPFAKDFEALGVVFNLKNTLQDKFMVQNKNSRAEDLGRIRNQAKLEGRFPPSLAATVKGRMQYAEGQMFGRLAALRMPEIKARALAPVGNSAFTQQIEGELTWGVNFIRESLPRMLIAHDPRPPLLIFTDAALEGEADEIATVGAVVIDRINEGSSEVRYFGDKVPTSLRNKLQSETPKVISALEVLPVGLALKVWSRRTMHRRIFIFVDNDAARASLIKMSSNSRSLQSCLLKVADILQQTPCFPWFCRVPSSSNIADGPSRLEFGGLLSTMNATRDVLEWQTFE